MIDLCPVGALTSKPFRYSARTWELSRRKSVSPHDGLGSNLVVQVKQNRVMRVLPLENEARERVLALGQGPLLLRGAQLARAPDAADGQARRPVAGGGLAGRRSSARLRRLKDFGVLASPHCDARGTVSRGASSARRGLPPAAQRFLRRRQARGHSLARHADRRARQARPRAGGRLVPAQGPSAASRTACARPRSAARRSTCCIRWTTTG